MGAGELDIGPWWTLFLDRDGVINRRIVGGYVTHWGEWEWLPGVKEAVASLSRTFGKVIVVTNQQGVGKGRMTESDLHAIHARMTGELASVGGRVDAVYACPHLESAGCSCRKPAPGLVKRACSEHPDIDLGRSVLVGDGLSDMELALSLGIAAVFVGEPPADLVPHLHASVGSLAEAAALLTR